MFLSCVTAFIFTGCYYYTPMKGTSAPYSQEEMASMVGKHRVYQFKLKDGSAWDVQVNGLSQETIACTRILGAGVRVPETIWMRDIIGIKVRHIEPVKTLGLIAIPVAAGILALSVLAHPQFQ